jgi:HAD superfamily phosphatase (TIGR01668 family)
MFKIFLPSMYVQSVHKIPYSQLLAEGIDVLLFDIDNTLAPFDVPDAPDEIRGLIKDLKGLGFRLCLLSNNGEPRVSRFAAGLNLPYVYRARKPLSYGVEKALAMLETDSGSAALVGDQLFSDIWCGRGAGLRTILVKPISSRDELTVKIKRVPERLLLKHFLKMGLSKFGWQEYRTNASNR